MEAIFQLSMLLSLKILKLFQMQLQADLSLHLFFTQNQQILCQSFFNFPHNNFVAPFFQSANLLIFIILITSILILYHSPNQHVNKKILLKSIAQPVKQKMYSDNPLLSSYEQIMKLMSSSTKVDLSRCQRVESSYEQPCNQCELFNQMLKLAQLRYNRLQSQNYAGELTISALKDKNQELMRKLRKNRDSLSTKQSCEEICGERFCKESEAFFEQESWNKDKNILQNFIDTFNPKQLKKILSDKTMELPTNDSQNTKQNKNSRQILMKSQSQHLNINNNSSFQDKQNSEQTVKKVKKHFNLSEFKEKNRLNGKQHKINNFKIMKAKQEPTKFEFYRF